MPDARIRPELHALLPGKSGSVVGVLPVALTAAMIAISAAAGAEDRARPQPELERLKATVAKLASQDMEGRQGEGARKAASFLIDEFRRLKLEPLFQGQFIQEVPAANEPGRIQGATSGPFSAGPIPFSRTSGSSSRRITIIWEFATEFSTPAPTTTRPESP